MSLTNIDVLQGNQITPVLFTNMLDLDSLNKNFNDFGYKSNFLKN